MSGNNLPSQPTTFIGRETEIAEIIALLAKPDCRLLTLVGPGGIGKTRLALTVAERILTDDGPQAFTDQFQALVQTRQGPGILVESLENDSDY